MELNDKKVMILVEQVFNDHEFWYPYYRLKEAGATVLVVGSGSSRSYAGKYGTLAAVDMDASEAASSLCDGIIIPGGYAPDHMRRYPEMVKLVRDHYQAEKVVAAICHAGWMLASAGILKGRTVTSFVAIRDDLVNAGAKWVDKPVVVDSNLITSRKPEDLPIFMKTVVSALKNG
ncbi:MAG: type 1 glutamine amidotransferase [Deltaproteobacteria bacterium]|nr:type 1 glutamine amidotransferase [Deltaproteobacteria bacterium]